MSNTTKYADHADEFNEALGRFDAAEAAKDAKAGQDGAQDAQDAAQKPEQGHEAHEGADDGHEAHEGAEGVHEGAEGAEGAEGDHEGAESPNREAARYRRRLRDTERERDELRGRLDVYLARDVEQVAAGFLDSPALLWADGKASAADFVDDKGVVDRAKVKAAADAILSRYGRGLASRRGTAPNEGRTPASAPKPGFREAFSAHRNDI